MKSFIAALAGIAIALPTLSAAAQSTVNTSNPRDIIPFLNPEMVEHVLDEAGMNAEMRYAEGQGEYLVVTHEGQEAIFVSRVCVEAGCLGLLMYAVLDDNADLETINRFNGESGLVSVVLMNNGQIGIQRYLIADYGVPRGSLEVNVREFFTAVELWKEYNAY